jgi:acetoin utilization protein AcuB
MFVERSMTRKVTTAPRTMKLTEARELMSQKGFRHLPVVGEDNVLIGMVTDRDIRSVTPPSLFQGTATEEERKAFAALEIQDVMSTDLIKISPMDTIQDALLLVQRTKVGALPVVDEHNRLRGILSVRDLLRAFINVLGIGEPGTLLCILVEEKVGQLKKIVDAITEENVSFGSILVARYWDKNMRAVFPYLLSNQVGPVKRKLKGLGYKLLDPKDWFIDELPHDKELP